MSFEHLTIHVQRDVQRALEEDVGSGDITASLIPQDQTSQATIISRENAVLCGTAWADAVFRTLDPDCRIHWHKQDSDTINENDLLCEIEGLSRALLTGERSALNFLQTLSGTASTARKYAAAVAHTNVKVLDTRKTIPGLRVAQKYAVECGGCHNHRVGLFDAYLIKENHILAAGSIASAIQLARQINPDVLVEVEVESLDELQQALAASSDIILLDNFDRRQLKKAVAQNKGQAKLEASGNVTLKTIAGIAETGVDYISSGELTKHIHAVDFSMRFL